MIDIARELVDAIKADPVLSAALGDNVFAYRVPQGAVPPLAVVLVAQETRATFPQTQWWRNLSSVDFHADTPGDSLHYARRMQEIAPTIVGTRTTCVISDCQVESRQPIIDDGWTPTRFRQVVTVNTTAREP